MFAPQRRAHAYSPARSPPERRSTRSGADVTGSLSTGELRAGPCCIGAALPPSWPRNAGVPKLWALVGRDFPTMSIHLQTARVLFEIRKGSVAEAVAGAALAAVVVLATTPAARRLARRIGAVDRPSLRGISQREVPRLGGLAVLLGILAAAVVFDPLSGQLLGLLLASIWIVAVGAIDDVCGLPPLLKLLGQAGAAALVVATGADVTFFTFPFVHRVNLGDAATPLTILGLLALMNAVNLIDGTDGLAAGVVGIAATAFSIIAFDLQRNSAGVFASILAGASFGFLRSNFPPATIFLGDSGSNLLGLLIGAVVIEGDLKKQALLALFAPAVVLALPLLDMSFVILKRLKYRQPVFQADAWHFHHRLRNVGFTPRRILLYLYGWSLTMSGLAVAQRYINWHDRQDHLRMPGALFVGLLALPALLATVYVAVTLELGRLPRRRAGETFPRRRFRSRPGPSPKTSEAVEAVPNGESSNPQLVVGRDTGVGEGEVECRDDLGAGSSTIDP